MSVRVAYLPPRALSGAVRVFAVMALAMLFAATIAGVVHRAASAAMYHGTVRANQRAATAGEVRVAGALWQTLGNRAALPPATAAALAHSLGRMAGNDVGVSLGLVPNRAPPRWVTSPKGLVGDQLMPALASATHGVSPRLAGSPDETAGAVASLSTTFQQVGQAIRGFLWPTSTQVTESDMSAQLSAVAIPSETYRKGQVTPIVLANSRGAQSALPLPGQYATTYYANERSLLEGK
jgi:hypothetical protein